MVSSLTTWHEEESRKARAAANVFVEAIKRGESEAIKLAAYQLDLAPGSWAFAIRAIGRLERVPSTSQMAFVDIWVQHKMLPLALGTRKPLARALRKLFPRHRIAAPLIIYRGASLRERKARAYGFSWSTDLKIVHSFAEKWLNDGGVVLRTRAPPDAILLKRERGDYYDEAEVVVDPFKLVRVFTHELLQPSHAPEL